MDAQCLFSIVRGGRGKSKEARAWRSGVAPSVSELRVRSWRHRWQVVRVVTSDHRYQPGMPRLVASVVESSFQPPDHGAFPFWM